ncbi:uncharacterized protein [Anabrus simplex]|uniref:uncharacterized protein isoform X2 n=1 Tax=Anabrus simplex TaxID=316456 RepID=UPI0035A3C30F
MSENGETQNETPTESDKMDISEVSDQVSPVSDQSELDNRHSGVARPVLLDNASAVAASLHNSTTSKTTTMTSTTSATGDTRGRQNSTLSLEGLDLELPPLDMYQEEYAEFPSSPKHLKERLEAHGLSMPLERDSGTTGGSEEEEEDTSIYQAVLSPDCQDVRLRKESNSANTDVPKTQDIAEEVSPGEEKREPEEMSEDKLNLRRVLLPNPEDGLLPNLYGAMGDIHIVLEPSSEEQANNRKNNSKTLMAVHSEPVFGNRSKVSGAGDINIDEKKKHKSYLDIPVASTHDDTNNDDDSGFVFERRDSKRLIRKELGERIMEGLFVESRNKDELTNSGLRKIHVPEDLDLMNSPTIERPNPLSFAVSNNNHDIKNVSDNFRGQIEVTPGSQLTNKLAVNGLDSRIDKPVCVSLKPQPTTRKTQTIELDNSHTPVPAIRSRNESSLTMPPCPKPRRKYKGSSDNETTRGPVLLLDPTALERRSPRAVPRVNPDGSVEVQQERPGSLVASQRGGRRKIQVSADILNGPTEEDNVSSGDSRLSDTDMVSPDDDPDLDALLSPDLDTPDELEDSILERLGEPPPAPEPIPELSAAEERAEARSWRNCIVAGLERRIDMKVIEPYKRVLSHGGYLAAGSHNAIIVFSACFLPDRSRVDYDYVMDNLFLYVLTTLDQLITEDYVLIYLHGATSRSCMPTFSWLKRCYQMIDRRLRKNLKGLYLVHPTFWLKTIVVMTRPFVSSKFSRKLRFVESLQELSAVVPLEQASIPDRVKQYDQIRLSLQQQANN